MASRPLVVALVCLGLFLAAQRARAAELVSWSPAGEMSAARYGAVAARLPDGRVLVTGGSSDNGAGLRTTETFDPLTNSWSPAASMTVSRTYATAVALPDGRVLVAGGVASTGALLASAEIYDPATGAWSPTGKMTAGRVSHGATLLGDGRVLVVGGDGPEDLAAGAETWDPTSNAWTPTGPVRRVRTEPAVTRLPDGRVLVAGGWDGQDQATAELFDPAADTWADASPMREPRTGPGAASLPDGRVVVAGGRRWVDGHPDTSRTSEILDPRTDRWTRSGDLNTPRGEGAQMVVASDGRPVIVGGFWWTVVHPSVGGELPTWSDPRYEDTAEVFDSTTGVWTQSAAMQRRRAGHVAVALADGGVLVAGGYGAGSLAERLGAAAPPVISPPPVTSPPPETGTPPLRAQVTVIRPRAKLLRASRTGRFTVKVRCGPGPCYDQLVVRSARGRHRVLARIRFALVAGSSARLPMRLSRSMRRQLAGRTVPVTLRLTDQRVAVKAKLRMPRRPH
jgi:Kelch motif/Galactose oxidase, central domain